MVPGSGAALCPCHSAPQLGLPPSTSHLCCGSARLRGPARLQAAGMWKVASAQRPLRLAWSWSTQRPSPNSQRPSGFTPGWGAPALPLPTGAQSSLASEAGRRSVCPSGGGRWGQSEANPTPTFTPDKRSLLLSPMTPPEAVGALQLPASEPRHAGPWASRPRTSSPTPCGRPSTLTRLASSSPRAAVGSLQPAW